MVKLIATLLLCHWIFESIILKASQNNEPLISISAQNWDLYS